MNIHKNTGLLLKDAKIIIITQKGLYKYQTQNETKQYQQRWTS